MRRWSPVFFLGFLVASVSAGPLADPAPYGRLLARFVKDGAVDYPGLRKNPADLKIYLESLAKVSASAYGAASAEERLAYLINSYNAHTLQLIVEQNAVSSIKDIDRAWDTPSVSFVNEKITLNELEHQRIRKEFSDPRVHFALVCAARGCPPLREEPYTAKRLESQLEDQTRRFLSDRKKNRFENGTLYLSPIFDWYRNDFKQGIVEFVAPYLFVPRGKKPRIRFTAYDWSLNSTGSRLGE